MTKTTNKYSPEVRERAVRMVLDGAGQHESRWAALVSISSKWPAAGFVDGNLSFHSSLVDGHRT